MQERTLFPRCVSAISSSMSRRPSGYWDLTIAWSIEGLGWDDRCRQQYERITYPEMIDILDAVAAIESHDL